jgi:hypothetical protein
VGDPQEVDPTYQQASIAALARTTADYYKALVKEGVGRKEALTLAVAFIQEIVRGARNGV